MNIVFKTSNSILKRSIILLVLIYFVLGCSSKPKIDWFKKSEEALHKEQWAEVINHVNKLMETDNHGIKYPKYKALYYRGVAYLKRDKEKLALKDYNQSIELNKSFPHVYVSRGVIHHDMNKKEQALSDFNTCLKISRSVFAAYYFRGCEYMDRKKYEHALADFTRAIGLNPQSPYSYLQRGKVYTRVGNYENAISDFSKCLDIDSDIKIARIDRGFYLFYLKRFSDSHSDFSKLVKIDPDFLYHKIWHYLSSRRSGQKGRNILKGFLKETDEDMWPIPVMRLLAGEISLKECEQRAVHADKKKDLEQKCEAHFYIGQYYLLKGKRSRAKQYFKKCIEAEIVDFYEYKGAMAELFPERFKKKSMNKNKLKVYLRYMLVDLNSNEIIKYDTLCSEDTSCFEVIDHTDPHDEEAKVIKLFKDEPLLEDRSLSLNENFIIRRRIYGSKKIPPRCGFGITLDRTDRRTFSWEWYKKEDEKIFKKLQGPGSLEIGYAKRHGYHVISRMHFKGDHVLRCKNFPKLGSISDWHCIIFDGSFIEWH